MNDIFRSRLEILVGEYFLYQEIATPKGCKHLIDSFIDNLDQMVLDQQDSCQEIIEALTTLSID